jgi:hypothetical protein
MKGRGQRGTVGSLRTWLRIAHFLQILLMDLLESLDVVTISLRPLIAAPHLFPEWLVFKSFRGFPEFEGLAEHLFDQIFD